MSNKTKLFSVSALATLAALAGNSINAHAATPPKAGVEKCYGVVKAKMNDCGTATHGCAAQAKVNSSPNEWIFLPKGICEKLAGGSLTPGGSSKNTNGKSTAKSKSKAS